MSLVEKLPDELGRQLHELLADDESVLLSAATDVTPDGDYGEEWLVATARRARVFSAEDGVFRCRLDLPLEGLREAKVESMIGGGALEALVEGRRVILVHYSNSLADKFGFLAKALNQLAEKGSISLDPGEHEARRCKSCGRTIPSYHGICPVCIDRAKTLRRLLGYARPLWKKILLAALLSLAGTAAALVPAELTRLLLDNVILPAAGKHLPLSVGFSRLVLLVAALGAARLLGALLEFWRGWLMAWLGGAVTRAVRESLFHRFQRLQLRFFDRQQTGQLISRATRDTDGLQWFIIEGVQMLSINVLLILGILALMAAREWRLALVVLAPTPIVALASVIAFRKYHPLYHRLWHRWSELCALVGDVVAGIRVVKAFTQERRETDRFDGRNLELFSSTVTAERMYWVYHVTISVATGLGMLLAWLYGGSLVLRGQLEAGVLMEFTFLLGMFYSPVQMLGHFPDWFQRAMTAAERIFEVLDSEPEPYLSPRAKPRPQLEGRVEFRNVTFGYDRHNPVIHDVTFLVEPGQMLGLVGHSGAGKSTIINLLCRFYEPDEGEILVDGRPLPEIRLEDLRRQIGVVPQESFLFFGTIAENIAYGRAEASLEEIIAAARAANAHDFILAFPDGYDTRVGERGARLSVGERQRIAIARALLHDPRILILDEATASVDTEAEREIQEALARLVRNRTTFAIAHRLSTLRNADKLLVLDQGRLVEQGTHNELMAMPEGVYRKLVRLQREVSRTQAVGG
jgi:ATP-binding cassette subfamily B protein